MKIVSERNVGDLVNNYLSHQHKSQYSANEEGIWEVFGEDENCDLGGPHHQPFLGRFEGRFIDVLTHAVALPAFYTWGGGGEIKKHEPIITHKVVQGGYDITQAGEAYAAKKKELERLKREICELEKRLGR